MNTRFLSLLVCTLLCITALPTHAKRVALVIGNDNYLQVKKLDKAGNDADAMAREFRAAGFEVTKYRDLDLKKTVIAFESFFDRINGGDEVAVFYAGHGVQTKTGSYLLPIDIEGETEGQIEKTSYSVNTLLDDLEKTKPQFTLVIIDACRDNPLRARGRAVGNTRGLTPPEPAKGQMVVMSASRGQQALDSLNDRDTDPNGVFTREFIARMRKPGLPVEALAKEVQSSVERLASTVGHSQRPIVLNETSGNYYFFAPTVVTIVAPAADIPTPAPKSNAGTSEAERELSFWNDTKAPDNIEGYEAYLVVYPTGLHAGLARAHITRLKAAPTGTKPAPEPAKPTEKQVPASAPVVVAIATQPTRTRVTLANGDRYDGEVIGIVRTGQGTYYFTNGDRYEGNFVDNVIDGAGTFFYASGDRYVGDFSRGIKQGKGAYQFANVDRYEGEFSDNVFSGKGTLSLTNGDRYEGEFRGNVKEGQGVHYFANKERYEGGFKGGLQFGTGKHFYANGDHYTGQFSNGVRHGKGVYQFANGLIKEFEFINGVEKPD